MTRIHRKIAAKLAVLALAASAAPFVGCGDGGNSLDDSGGWAGGGGADGIGGASGTGASAGTGGASALKGYFVAPDGDDENPGTEAAPFRTLAKARDVLRGENADMASDLHVYLRGGVHRLDATVSFGVEDSGTNGHRIYYEAYPGEVPVVRGSTPVSGWTQHDANIFKAPLERATKLRNLYVNDHRALMANKRVTSKGGVGTYSVTAGQADWAWTSGTASDGVKYAGSDVPALTSNKDDLEIVNGTTWNENIVCSRDVTTAGDGSRVILFQEPYGAIAQQPGWGAGFSVNGSHTLVNALEFLDEPGEFYFDKTTKTLYYQPLPGEDMALAEVEAPFVETLIDVHGTSTSNRVRNITFRGITFEDTDYNLHRTGDSSGKASCQGATVFTAFLAGGDWHSTTYEVVDTFPGVIVVNSADSIEILDGAVEHGGSEGISMINDVIHSRVVGNVIRDIAGSGLTVGHPQHVYIGDGGTHAKYTAAEEGTCVDIVVENNLFYDVSSVPGFGGHSGITAFFPDHAQIEHNQIELTAYNGISLGWGWRNFKDSTTCRDNSVSFNRFIDTLSRLHDSGAIYTIGQMPGTTIDENYVRGIPPAISGPTYGLHNDEGSAYIVENDNVLDISPGVKYTINCEDFGEKHDLTILRTYATVNKMGVNPPMSTIDPPVAVSDNVWPLPQYGISVASGIEDQYQHIVPESVLSRVDRIFPASAAAKATDGSLPIRGSQPNETVWLAPEGTTEFSEGATMTKAAGGETRIGIPTEPGNYKLHLLDAKGQKQGESVALLRVNP